MASVLVWTSSTKKAQKKNARKKREREQDRIARLWQPVPVKISRDDRGDDIDVMWRYRATGEVVFQPDESLLSF